MWKIAFILSASLANGQYCDTSDNLLSDLIMNKVKVPLYVHTAFGYNGDNGKAEMNVSWTQRNNNESFSINAIVIKGADASTTNCTFCEDIQTNGVDFITIHEFHTINDIYMENYNCSAFLYLIRDVDANRTLYGRSEQFRFVLEANLHHEFMKPYQNEEGNETIVIENDETNATSFTSVDLFKYISISLSVFIMVLCISLRKTYFLLLFEKLCRKNAYAVNRMEEINELYTKDCYEMNRNNVHFVRELDSGHFGVVYEGRLDKFTIDNQQCTKCALKLCKAEASEQQKFDFRNEIQILKSIGVHKHIVQFYGHCITSEPYLLIMEFIDGGNFRNYLIKLRNTWNENDSVFFTEECESSSYIQPNSEYMKGKTKLSSASTEYTTLDDENSPLVNKIDTKELQRFAMEIALGMAHLESLQITHRDLAARNILITNTKRLKIADFGMSRNGIYLTNLNKTLPLRWCSIEWLRNQPIDCKSDVWSFAVVLWEIGTLGALPYIDIPNELLLMNLLNGVRLHRPELCTNQLYQLMLQCWLENPVERPSFQQIVQHLTMNKIYIDANRLCQDYEFPAT